MWITLMSYIKTTLVGFLGGAATWLLLLFLPGSGSFVFNLIKSDIVEPLTIESVSTPTPVVIFSDFWQKIVADHVLSTVAIQSFKDGKITREGSGIVISSDGVITTTFDVVAGADVYQILYSDKIMRAQLVWYDGFKNLALLRIAATGMDVTRLERNYQFQPGQDVVISGKIVEFYKPIIFVQRGMISHILFKDIVMDTEPSYFLSGSKVINNSGIVIGMAYLRSGTARLITAEVIDDFIKNYFQASDGKAD